MSDVTYTGERIAISWNAAEARILYDEVASALALDARQRPALAELQSCLKRVIVAAAGNQHHADCTMTFECCSCGMHKTIQQPTGTESPAGWKQVPWCDTLCCAECYDDPEIKAQVLQFDPYQV